jgi:uncharacterized protein
VKLERAYSLLEVKDISEEAGHYVITGMATTPTPDRMDDVVEPLGAKFAPTIPLLWQHDPHKPVGHTEFGKPTAKGIPFTARIPKVEEPGVLKDRIDEAVQSVRYRLVAAVSIGFRVLNGAIERLKTGGIKFLETEIMELSLVTIPANSEATISSIKSICDEQRAASGQTLRRAVRLIPVPGDSGQSKSAKRGAIQLIPR